jgi:hypothetical protein
MAQLGNLSLSVVAAIALIERSQIAPKRKYIAYYPSRIYPGIEKLVFHMGFEEEKGQQREWMIVGRDRRTSSPTPKLATTTVSSFPT